MINTMVYRPAHMPSRFETRWWSWRSLVYPSGWGGGGIPWLAAGPPVARPLTRCAAAALAEEEKGGAT